MERRSLLSAGVTLLLGAFGAGQAVAAAGPGPRQRVVYHLADIDRVVFVLGNMQNHVDGVGGPGKADIGSSFTVRRCEPFTRCGGAHRLTMTKLAEEQVGFDACANTMKAQGVKLDDLTPGFVVAEKGGVVRLAELQQQGYAYLRP